MTELNNNFIAMSSNGNCDGTPDDLVDLDLEQDVARSAFADMILDDDRNQRYRSALRTVIAEKHRNDERAHVVDIGTGSGLLSLAAAEAGADRVTAIEMFHAVADIAEQIFKRSDFADKIRLIKSRSTDIAKDDLTTRGNIIVAEVFDSELIGEGALRTFKKAHGTLVEALTRKDLSSFNFEDPHSIHYNEHVIREFVVDPFACKLDSSVKVDIDDEFLSLNCVFMWWSLDMDGGGSNRITMAPTWIDPNSEWRDHWMQVAYFPPGPPQTFRRGDTVVLSCSHDEYAFQFSVGDRKLELNSLRPCLLHSVCARNALYRMNEMEQTRADLLDALTKFSDNRDVICLGEGSLFGLYASRTAHSVTIIEPDFIFRRLLLETAVDSNSNVKAKICILGDVDELDVDCFASNKSIAVIAEPYFFSSILTWNNVYRYLGEIEKIRKKIHGSNLKLDCFIKNMTIFAMSAKFEHLWKTCANIGVTLGFNLSPFNEVYQQAISHADNLIESYPLWEYPSIATGPPKAICSFEFNVQNGIYVQEKKQLDVEYAGTLRNANVSSEKSDTEVTNALTFWTSYKYSSDSCSSTCTSTSTGLINEEFKGENSTPHWTRAYRQGVYLFRAGSHENIFNRLSEELKLC